MLRCSNLSGVSKAALFDATGINKTSPSTGPRSDACFCKTSANYFENVRVKCVPGEAFEKVCEATKPTIFCDTLFIGIIGQR